jgi:hypothetical protein
MTLEQAAQNALRHHNFLQHDTAEHIFTDGFEKGANWQASQHEWVMEALENLVQLKRWKDKHGKDEHYVKNVDSAWQKAFDVIDKYTNKEP